MNGLSMLFWGVVVAALLISLRWGAMIGLIAFVFALMFGAVAISRWSPPRDGAVSAGASLLERGRVEDLRFPSGPLDFRYGKSGPGRS